MINLGKEYKVVEAHGLHGLIDAVNATALKSGGGWSLHSMENSTTAIVVRDINVVMPKPGSDEEKAFNDVIKAGGSPFHAMLKWERA